MGGMRAAALVAVGGMGVFGGVGVKVLQDIDI